MTLTTRKLPAQLAATLVVLNAIEILLMNVESSHLVLVILRYETFNRLKYEIYKLDIQTLFHGERYVYLTVQSPNWKGQYDALTSYGVNLWDPELHQWCEISVQGQCFSVRDTASRIGIPLESDFSNELKDGSIIDLHGVLLYFQKPYRVRQRLLVS